MKALAYLVAFTVFLVVLFALVVVMRYAMLLEAVMR